MRPHKQTQLVESPVVTSEGIFSLFLQNKQNDEHMGTHTTTTNATQG